MTFLVILLVLGVKSNIEVECEKNEIQLCNIFNGFEKDEWFAGKFMIDGYCPISAAVGVLGEIPAQYAVRNAVSFVPFGLVMALSIGLNHVDALPKGNLLNFLGRLNCVAVGYSVGGIITAIWPHDILGHVILSILFAVGAVVPFVISLFDP